MANQFFDIEAAPGRFDGVMRPYTEQDVARLRGSYKARSKRCSPLRAPADRAHAFPLSRPRASLPLPLQIEHTVAKLGSNKMWELLKSEPYIPALGALAGNQAVQARGGAVERWRACPAAPSGRAD